MTVAPRIGPNNPDSWTTSLWTDSWDTTQATAQAMPASATAALPADSSDPNN